MKSFFARESGILIAPMLLTFFMFFFPISSSLNSLLLALFILSVITTPYFRHLLTFAYQQTSVLLACLFFTYIVIACIWSEAPILMQLEVCEKYLKLLAIPFYAVVLSDPKTRVWVFNAFFSAILLTCFFSLLKKFDLLYLYNPDPGEVFYNHISTGFLVAIAVYYASTLIFQSGLNGIKRVFYGLVIVSGTLQLLFLNTGRTGYFIFAALMIFLILQKMPWEKAFLGIGILVLLTTLAYLTSPVMQEGLHSLANDVKFLKQNKEDTSLGFRVQFQNYAKKLFTQNPVFGVGTGAFKYHYSQEQPIPAWGIELNDPHSQYWMILGEGGIVGFLFYLTFLGGLFFTFTQSGTLKPIYFGTLLAYGIGSISDTIFCYSPAGTLLIIISSMCVGEILERKSFGALYSASASKSMSYNSL